MCNLSENATTFSHFPDNHSLVSFMLFMFYLAFKGKSKI